VYFFYCGKNKTKAKNWNCKRFNVEMEAEQRDNPCRYCSAYVCTESYADGLLQRHEPCVYKRYFHDCCCAGRLDNHGKNKTGQETGKPIARHETKRILQTFTGTFLYAVAHHIHAVQQECKASDELQYCCNYIHRASVAKKCDFFNTKNSRQMDLVQKKALFSAKSALCNVLSDRITKPVELTTTP